jgi:extracellular factor (EF) 3-hydroxypalmitic acid methyl ester biosynthesis protein
LKTSQGNLNQQDPSEFGILEIRNALLDIARRDGPSEQEYGYCSALMDRISLLRSHRVISDPENDDLWSTIGEASTPKTLMGFIYKKPHGYHGDFEIIDRFYSKHISSEPHLHRWDRWIQSLEATEAVRNRKDFFKQLVSGLQCDRLPCILSVGSGPCREISESYSEGQRFEVTCLDLDPKAISYARSNVDPGSVTFLQKNALRMNFKNEYDLVWSAGLFDYLEDRLFIIAIKKMHRAARLGGEIVIGNFSENNPSRSAMEWGNWYLIHRTEQELRRLVDLAGIPSRSVKVLTEPLGINLFLSISKVDEVD